jgi:hypothetical protein
MADATIQPVRISLAEGLDVLERMTAEKGAGEQCVTSGYANMYCLVDHGDGLAHIETTVSGPGSRRKTIETQPFSVGQQVFFFAADSDDNGADEIYVASLPDVRSSELGDTMYAFDVSASLFGSGCHAVEKGWRTLPDFEVPYDVEGGYFNTTGEGCFGTDPVFDDDPLHVSVEGGVMYVREEADDDDYRLAISPEMVLEKAKGDYFYMYSEGLRRAVEELLVCAALETPDTQTWQYVRNALWMFRDSKGSMEAVEGLECGRLVGIEMPNILAG